VGIRATIDDVEVPIASGDIPAFSFSVLDLEEPDKLKGTSSTTFKMPATRDVRAVLGGPGMAETVTNIRPRLRIGNGGQVLYESKVVPIERNRDEYSVIAVGDNAEWFDLAKSTKLRSLDMGTSPTIDDTLMRDSWIDEDVDLRFPGIDFGSFENRTVAHNVTVNKIRPAINVHRFLRAAFALWGFSLRPMGSIGVLWKKFVVPNTFGSIKIGEDFLRNASATAYQTASPSYSALNTDTEFTFNANVFDPSGSLTGTGRFQPTFTLRTEVQLNYDLSAVITNGSFTPASMVVRFEFYNFTSGTSLGQQSITMNNLNPAAIGSINFGQFDMAGSQEFGIRIRLTAPGTILHVVTVNPTTYIKYIVRNIEYQEGVTVNVAEQAPDMTVMELLKSITGNRCMIVKTNAAHGEVQLWLDTEFYRGTDVGVDWRDRLDHNNPPTKQVPMYARRIEYRWKDDSNDRDLLNLADSEPDPGYGNADVEMENGTEDPITVEMPFAPTAMGALFDGNVFWPVSRKEDGVFQVDDYDREPRLLIMDGLADGAWRFDGVNETQYPRCYFINPSGRYTLAFGSGAVYGDEKLGTAQLQWADRQRRMMTPTLKGDVMIWPDEIWNIDQGVPRLINDGETDVWFYPQRINQFQFATPDYTEVVLLPLT
jgi:hypothetical protein